MILYASKIMFQSRIQTMKKLGWKMIEGMYTSNCHDMRLRDIHVSVEQIYKMSDKCFLELLKEGASRDVELCFEFFKKEANSKIEQMNGKSLKLELIELAEHS
jgi:hypothetical protein